MKIIRGMLNTHHILYIWLQISVCGVGNGDWPGYRYMGLWEDGARQENLEYVLSKCYDKYGKIWTQKGIVSCFRGWLRTVTI